MRSVKIGVATFIAQQRGVWLRKAVSEVLQLIGKRCAPPDQEVRTFQVRSAHCFRFDSKYET